MKLHEVLKDALHYLEMCEANPNIIISMNAWFEWQDEGERGTCFVCLAGAYFCKGVINKKLAFDCNEDPIYDVLNALRLGHVRDALWYIGIQDPGLMPVFAVCEYENDSAGFVRDMYEIIEYLKSRDY